MTSQRPAAQTPQAAPVRGHRPSVTAAYATQGFGFAVMLTNVPTYKERLGMGDDTITLVVLGVCVCAGIGSALSGVAAARLGSARVVQAGLLLAAAAVAAVGWATSWPVFFMAFAVYGVMLGAVDASANMQGIALERQVGRSLLSSLFAANAAGGVVGALSVSGVAALGLSLPVALTAVAALVVGSVLVLRGGLVPVEDELVPSASAPTDERSTPGGGLVRASVIVVLGAAMLAYPVADSAVSSWGATFLRDVLGASAVVAPLGFGAYQAMLIASRLLGDRWVERMGRVRVVRWGGAVGTLGLLAVAAAPVWPVAVLGFAATGLGLGVVAPLAFSAAGDRAAEAAGQDDGAVRTLTDWAVARLNVFTYAGAVLGGVLTGVFATSHQLRAGVAVLAGLAFVSAVLAGAFRESEA